MELLAQLWFTVIVHLDLGFTLWAWAQGRGGWWESSVTEDLPSRPCRPVGKIGNPKSL